MLDTAAPTGPTLVFHYGTPMGLVPMPMLIDAAAARGLRVLVCARPGYDRSTPKRGRRVGDVAGDVAAVLDHLRIDEFVTCGWSGGGPHALACGVLLRDRCRWTTTLASVAPYGAAGLDWIEGMGPENVEEFSAAVAGDAVLTDGLSGFAPLLAEVSADTITASLGGLLAPADRTCLEDDGFAEFRAASARASVSGPHGIAGWRDDDLAFVADWGFDVADNERLTLWHGTDDLMVPIAHARWLAQALPGSRAHLIEGEGHLSVVLGRLGDVLDELAAA